jgi:hypothetical protein
MTSPEGVFTLVGWPFVFAAAFCLRKIQTLEGIPVIRSW